jgi:drug/metabolite transporter (DMT)-like permease
LLLLNLKPVFTAFLAWILFQENFDRRFAVGMAAIAVGGVVLAWSLVESRRLLSGPLLIGLACLCMQMHAVDQTK